MKYLSETEQFKDILNNEEINMIENSELREIRTRFWYMRHLAFIDENNIRDDEIDDVFNKLIEEEKKELELFKSKYSK